MAVLTAPLVLLSLKRDFWHPFHDYAVADRGHKSTFSLYLSRIEQASPLPERSSRTEPLPMAPATCEQRCKISIRVRSRWACTASMRGATPMPAARNRSS